MKFLVVCRDIAQKIELEKIITLTNSEVTYHWKNTLSKLDVEKVDVIISVGGDGTALSASHFITSQPLLAVNSDPKRSVGALTTCTLKELPKKIKEIQENKFKTEKLERIDVYVNNKLIQPTALNEVFLASVKAYLISKYKITFDKKTEIQRSSGLIVATGTGSTAWFKSAGGNSFPKNAPYIKAVTREPYEGYGKTKFKYILKKATIHHGNSIVLHPLVPMVLSIDSIREVYINQDDVIEIKASTFPLKRIR